MPVIAALPERLAVVVLQISWSAPAVAVVGRSSIVITTSSVDEGQVPLAIVHSNVVVDPAARLVIPELAELVVVIIALPAMTLQLPIPIIGVLPLSTDDVVLHSV